LASLEAGKAMYTSLEAARELETFLEEVEELETSLEVPKELSWWGCITSFEDIIIAQSTMLIRGSNNWT